MITKTIQQRRSVFPAQYNEQPITKQEINSILEAANWAPTHRKTEPWRFKVFHGASQQQLADFLCRTYQETTEHASDFKQRQISEKVLRSGCVIAICMQRDPKERVPEWEEIAATAMAVQNMWLAATELHIGAYWSSPSSKDHVGKLLDLQPGELCLGFFYMGKYDGEATAGQRHSSIEEKTQWV